MVNPTESTNAPSPRLRRARVACRACNARRVKCDAGDRQPCWHCRMRQTECVLIESKRGRYARKERGSARNQLPSRQSQRVSDVTGSQVPRQGPSVPIGRNTGASIPNDPGHCGPTQSPSNEEADRESRNETDHQYATQQPHRDHIQYALHQEHTDESSGLFYVLELSYKSDSGSTEPLRVRHPIPASIADRCQSNYADNTRTTVTLQEALTLPSLDLLDQLVRVFFEKIHPAYPVFDRERFMQSYSMGRASPFVLQTIALLGFTIGSDELIRAAGFSDRATARKTHYLRAKALYDVDYESDRVILVAVLLLLGFWWAGPDDQKDICYWIGCATTVAQSLGMHRAMPHSTISPRMRSLRKRIWWSIYTRDRHTCAAFGRPCHIRDEDCDVEPLTEEDFSIDICFDKRLIPAQRDFHVSYVLEMSKLAIILGDILTGEFSPRRPSLEKFDTESLAQRLTQWEAGLPDQLRINAADEYSGGSFWAAMLQFSYQNCLILLFRPKAIENLSQADARQNVRARTAADSITRLAEDLLTTRMIDSALVQLVPALFSALSVHTLVICRNDPVQRQLAENKSRQCMLALSVIAKSWPVRIWISKSFVSLMKRLTAQGSSLRGSIVNVSSTIVTSKNVVQPVQMGADTEMIEDCQLPGNFEPNSYCTCNAGPQLGVHHTQDCLWKAPDQFLHDSLWAGYLDELFGGDLFLRDLPSPMQNVPLDEASSTTESNTANL
ncbi:fungal-specific transcription factor domain-containing protein [Aspergillus ambiguus]|uniref:Zn(II)2Cys6 transcription factor n=1 Tax=Aspergillus ambiguus TaxID=176160 RepID=UPI003CCCE76E